MPRGGRAQTRTWTLCDSWRSAQRRTRFPWPNGSPELLPRPLRRPSSALGRVERSARPPVRSRFCTSSPWPQAADRRTASSRSWAGPGTGPWPEQGAWRAWSARCFGRPAPLRRPSSRCRGGLVAAGKGRREGARGGEPLLGSGQPFGAATGGSALQRATRLAPVGALTPGAQALRTMAAAARGAASSTATAARTERVTAARPATSRQRSGHPCSDRRGRASEGRPAALGRRRLACRRESRMRCFAAGQRSTPRRVPRAQQSHPRLFRGSMLGGCALELLKGACLSC